jgi:hypothetical protein
VGVDDSDIKVCCAAEYGDSKETGVPDRDPKNPPSSGDDDRATYCANTFEDCESGTGDMLRGGVGVEEPDEFVDRGLSPVLTSDAVEESTAPSTMLKAVFVKGSDDLTVPNCNNELALQCVFTSSLFPWVPTKQYLSTSSWYDCEVSGGFSETKAAGFDVRKVALFAPALTPLMPFSCLKAAFATLWAELVTGTLWKDCFAVVL